MQRGEDRRVEERFVPLWTFTIPKCKTRKYSTDEPCFNVFTYFDGIIQLFQAQDGLRELQEPGQIRRKTM